MQKTAELSLELKQTLLKSMGKISGLPRAVMFSGGFDSMLMVLLAQHYGARVTAVTVRFDDYNPRTVLEAAILARKMRLSHHVIHVTLEEFLSAYGPLSSLIKGPILDLDLVLVHAAFKKYDPKAAGKVFISGMGSDQWFGDALDQAAIDEGAHHKVARAHGYKFIFPFLSKPVLALSQRVPAGLKKNKKLLRELAAEKDASLLLARGTRREIQVPSQVRRLVSKVYGPSNKRLT